MLLLADGAAAGEAVAAEAAGDVFVRVKLIEDGDQVTAQGLDLDCNEWMR